MGYVQQFEEIVPKRVNFYYYYDSAKMLLFECFYS